MLPSQACEPSCHSGSYKLKLNPVYPYTIFTINLHYNLHHKNLPNLNFPNSWTPRKICWSLFFTWFQFIMYYWPGPKKAKWALCHAFILPSLARSLRSQRDIIYCTACQQTPTTVHTPTALSQQHDPVQHDWWPLFQITMPEPLLEVEQIWGSAEILYTFRTGNLEDWAQ